VYSLDHVCQIWRPAFSYFSNLEPFFNVLFAGPVDFFAVQIACIRCTIVLTCLEFGALFVFVGRMWGTLFSFLERSVPPTPPTEGVRTPPPHTGQVRTKPTYERGRSWNTVSRVSPRFEEPVVTRELEFWSESSGDKGMVAERPRKKE